MPYKGHQVFLKVSDDTCVQIVSKVGSFSMRAAIRQVPHEEVTVAQALKLPRRVMFVRHPLTRLESTFNHFWWLTLNNVGYSDFIPSGIIRADGGRLEGRVGANEHRHRGKRKLDYLDRRDAAMKAGGGAAVAAVAARLKQEDWERFVDYVLSGGEDEHWLPQMDIAKYEGRIVANIAHRFEDVRDYWPLYVGGTLPELNSWQPVPKKPYRLAQLRKYYRETLDFWGGIDATWDAS